LHSGGHILDSPRLLIHKQTQQDLMELKQDLKFKTTKPEKETLPTDICECYQAVCPYQLYKQTITPF